MNKQIILIGTRPQFIKLCGFLLDKNVNDYIIIHSGQHYDYNMSSAFFDSLGIPEPHYNLQVQEDNLSSQLTHIIQQLQQLNLDYDQMIVFGDCITTLAGALYTKLLGKELIHIEGGIRESIPTMPEDLIRRIVDNMSDVIYVDNETERTNLQKEGKCNVHIISNLQLDVLQNLIDTNKITTPKETNYYILTIHRQEHTNTVNIKKILDAVNSSAHKIIFPVHPRTIKLLPKNHKIIYQNIIFKEPMDFVTFSSYLYHCCGVITDSGGIQYEANYLDKPCIVLNKSTGLLDNKNKVYIVSDKYHTITKIIKELK